MPKLVIMSGIAGSGKTRHARTYFPEYHLISADDYFMTGEGGRVYRFDPTKIGEAHSDCLRRFITAVSNSVNIVIDNTNCTVAEIAPYYAIGQAFGYEIRILTIECNPGVAAMRNTHGVSEITIGMMYANLRNRIFPPWWPNEIVKT